MSLVVSKLISLQTIHLGETWGVDEGRVCGKTGESRVQPVPSHLGGVHGGGALGGQGGHGDCHMLTRGCYLSLDRKKLPRLLYMILCHLFFK